MENKINIAELLKDCPKGMELDCTTHNGIVTFEEVFEPSLYPIRVSIKYDNKFSAHTFTKYGQIYDSPNTKCVIFPKGKDTWEGFVSPCKFKAGDVLVSKMGNIVLLSHIDSKNVVHYHCINPTYGGFRIAENTDVGVGEYYDCVLASEQQRQRIYNKIESSGYKYNQQLNKLEKLTTPKFKDGDIISDSMGTCIFKGEGGIKDTVNYYCGISHDYFRVKDDKCSPNGHYGNIVGYRLATEEEKQKLFDAIKANGYRWNDETKTLEELPRFKVGDRIKHISSLRSGIIVRIDDKGYYVDYSKGSGIVYISFMFEKNYKIFNNFDITTLKSFDKVLVRHNKDNKWCSSFFSHIDSDLYSHCYKYVTIAGKSYPMCIPYEGNEHLRGTTDDCDEYFKNWKE